MSISPEYYLVSLTHDPQSPDFPPVAKPVSLGDYVWLGARALILPGVEMGAGAVAGAGTVVSRAVAPYETVAEVPARKIGERSRDLRYSASYRPLFNTDVKLE